MLPPRVLIVMTDQWTRALLRGTLREIGYDAVGTRSLQSAMRISVSAPNRGGVHLIIIDQSAVDDKNAVDELLQRHRGAALLIARRTSATPVGPWKRILYRPLSVDDIVRVVQEILPLTSELQHPID